MKVLSTILAVVVLPIALSSAPADAGLAKATQSSKASNNKSTLELPPKHWGVFDSKTCTICHIDHIPPIPPGGIGRADDLQELVRSWATVDQLPMVD